MAFQPLYKGLGKAEFEGGEVKKNKNHCSLTLPISPSPLPLPQREGSEYRDTPMLNGKQEDMRKGNVNRQEGYMQESLSKI